MDSNVKRAGRTRNRGEAKRNRLKAEKQLGWNVPHYRDAFVEPLCPEDLHRVIDAGYRILEGIGVEFLHDEARDVLARAGARIDGDGVRVRIGRDIVAAALSQAPAAFDMVARNPARNFRMGDRRVVFSPVGSAPNATDIDRGRRTGNLEDYRNFLKLSQSFNCLHTIGGYPVEPIDVHPRERHLVAMREKLVLTDKVPFAYSLGVERIEDCLEMTRIAHGLDRDAFRAGPRLATIINTNSPLKIDMPMMDGAMRMARNGQLTVITPFTLAGAMAPVTLAGALAQQTAEFLAAATVLQLVAPGAPVAMGGFTSNVDMKSGAPAFGTPEYMRAAQISGQIARFFGVPYRASNVNASNAPDAQAVWESCFSLWGTITGGANFIMHGAGWLEGGLSASFEKFVIDCELIQNVMRYLEPVAVDEGALALDAIAEVGPGGHFFGCAHTQARYETAFYAPFLSDWRNYETWAEAGAPDATLRANAIWKRTLAEFEPPPLDPGVREELDAFVARRIEEGGAPTDF